MHPVREAHHLSFPHPKDASACTMFWHVSSKQSTDTRDGRSLDTAFRRILHAIHVAEAEDTIIVVPAFMIKT